jgi:trigger factor
LSLFQLLVGGRKNRLFAMSVTVSAETLGPCKKLLRIEVAAERVNAAFEQITGKFQREAQLPGFRAGKVPRHLVVRNFDARIIEETRRQLSEESFREATQQERLRVIVTLGSEELSFGRGQTFSYTVTLEHAPEFPLPSYKGLTVRRELATATDADQERAVNILRDQRAKYTDVQRPAAVGDIVVVNYWGTCEGKPISEFNATAVGLTRKENFWLLIGEGSFIPGFTEQLVGVNAGEKRTVNLTFPSDFVISEVVGKAGAFEVEVLSVKQKDLPVVDDAFAKEFGLESVDELMTGIRNDLQRELDGRSRRAVRDQLIQQLLAQTNFDVPESVLASETRSLVYNIVQENQKRGVAAELIESKKDEIYANAQVTARDRVKAGFVLNRIAEAEHIQVNNQEMSDRIVALARQNDVSPDKMAKALQERNAFPGLQQEILTGKVLDLIELQARIEDVIPSLAPAPAEASPAPAV